MTRALRRAHRIIFVLLAVLLPILAGLALAGRSQTAVVHLPASNAGLR